MHRLTVLGLLALAILLGACHSGGLSEAELREVIPVDSAWRCGTLENGLTYYIRHNEEPKDRVDFYLLLQVGSLQETESQRGLAHFLEHMAFNGSRHFKKEEIVKYAMGIGLDYGRDLNASTGVDNTEFYLRKVPVRESSIDSCLLVLRDWTDGLLLEDKEIEKERSIVHEEWRNSQSPSMRIYEQNLQQLYPGSLYGERLPIGKMEVIDNFNPDELRKFYHDWYRSDLQTIVVIGDIDVDQMEEKILAQFGDVKKSANVPEYHDTEVPDTDEPIYIINKDKEQETSDLTVMFKQDILPKEKWGTMAALEQANLTDILTSLLNARLMEFAQEPDCPYLQYSSRYGMYQISRTKDAFSVLIAPKQGQEVQALERVMQEVERIRRYGFTQTEWDRQIEEELSEWDDFLANSKRLTNGDYYQACRNRILLGSAMATPSVKYEANRRILASLSVKQANRLFKKLTESITRNFVVMASFPDDDSVRVPTREELQEAVSRARKAKLQAYDDQFRSGSLVEKLPKKGSVVKEESAEFGYTLWTLSNGARVYFKKTDFGDSEILMNSFSYGGDAYIDDSDWHTEKIFNDVASSIGLGDFKTVELSKSLMGKQVGVSLGLGELTEYVKGNCAPEDLKTLMEMVYLCFQEPTEDLDAYNQLMVTLKEDIKASQGKPEQDYSDSINIHYSAGDMRGWRLDENDLKKVSFKDFKKMYAKRFNSASDFDFIFTGSIDEDELREVVETYLASMPKVEKRETMDISRKVRKYEGNETVRFLHDMESPQAYVMMNWWKQVPVSSKDIVLAELLTNIISQRLHDKIREEQGLAYSVSFSCSADHVYHETSMDLYCECKPEQVNALLSTVRSNLNGIARYGVNNTEIKQTKQLLLKDYEEGLRSNSYWQWALYEKKAWGIDVHTDYVENLENITKEDLRKFFKNNLLDTPNVLSVIMEPTPEKRQSARKAH